MEEKEKLIDVEAAYVPTAEEKPVEMNADAELSEKELESITPPPQKAITTKSASKKVLLALLFVFVNVAVILGTALSEFAGDSKPISLINVWQTIKDNWIYGAVTITLFVVTILLDGAMRSMLLKTTLKKRLPLVSINATILCRYYDCITPLGSGGQPFEIYYLRKKGIPMGIASGVPIVTYCVQRLSYSLIALLVMVFHGFGEISLLLKILCVIGLVVNMFIPFAVVFFSIMPKVCLSVSEFIAKLAKKMHIVKDKEAFKHKLVDSITEYSDCIRYFVKKAKLRMLFVFLLSFFSMVALYSIPFFLIRMCGNPSADWWETTALCVICYTSVTMLPTPGNAGGAEMSFYSIFARFLTGGILLWGMLYWRIVTYYLYIVIGLVLIIIQQIYKLTKKGKAEDLRYKHILEAEKNAKKAAADAEKLYSSVPPEEQAATVCENNDDKRVDNAAPSDNGKADGKSQKSGNSTANAISDVDLNDTDAEICAAKTATDENADQTAMNNIAEEIATDKNAEQTKTQTATDNSAYQTAATGDGGGMPIDQEKSSDKNNL